MILLPSQTTNHWNVVRESISGCDLTFLGDDRHDFNRELNRLVHLINQQIDVRVTSVGPVSEWVVELTLLEVNQ